MAKKEQKKDKIEQEKEPDTAAEYPCLYVAEWICPIHVPDIPLEVCDRCIEARRLNMEQSNVKLQTVTRTRIPLPAPRAPVESPTPQPERVEKTSDESRPETENNLLTSFKTLGLQLSKLEGSLASLLSLVEKLSEGLKVENGKRADTST